MTEVRKPKSVEISWGRNTGRFLLLLALVTISLAVASYAVFSQRILSLELERVLGHAILDKEALSIKIDLLDQIFGIFLGVFAVLSGLFALLGVGLYTGLKTSLLKSVDSEVTYSVNVAQNQTQAWSFKEQSYIWSVIYDRTVQYYLRKEKPILSDDKIEDTLAYVSASLTASKQGLDRLEAISIDRNISKARAIDIERLAVEFENHILYAEVAQFILSKGIQQIESLPDMVARADSLYDRSITSDLKSVGFEYYKAHETVAFFKIHVGRIMENAELLASGKTLLASLVEGKRPKNYLKPPPRDWCENTRKEYEDNGVSIEEETR